MAKWKNPAPLKQKFLARKGHVFRSVSLLDVAVLLFHAIKIRDNPEIGWLDPNQTVEQILKRLNQRILVPQTTLESLLSACNMLNEIGKFEHILPKSFDEFLKESFTYAKFDKVYNTLTYPERKKEQSNESR